MNIPDCQGRTPLHIACRTENESVVRCLLNHGAAMEALTAGELQTPLHYAARHDAAKVIEVLHEFGAGLNPRDYKGRTPLLLAAELDRSVAALQLLEAGAKAGIIDKTGNQALRTYQLMILVLKLKNILSIFQNNLSTQSYTITNDNLNVQVYTLCVPW